jgi:Leucine-rich repeat (LRR) protein
MCFLMKLQIDIVPKDYSNVETIFLSNNSIEFLENFKQFKRLKVLSIANNLVSYLLYSCILNANRFEI